MFFSKALETTQYPLQSHVFMLTIQPCSCKTNKNNNVFFNKGTWTRFDFYFFSTLISRMCKAGIFMPYQSLMYQFT